MHVYREPDRQTERTSDSIFAVNKLASQAVIVSSNDTRCTC